MVDDLKSVGIPESYPVKPTEIDRLFSPTKTSTPKGETRNSSSISFKDLLMQAIDSVNNLQVEADKAAQELAITGNVEKIPEVLIKMKKAEIAFDALLSIRNKLIDAYQELQRMNI